MSLEDIKEALRIKYSEEDFITFFEITIEDLVERFTDLIEEQQDTLPYELEMEVTLEEIDEQYEDKE